MRIWVIVVILVLGWFVLYGGVYTAVYVSDVERLDALKNFGTRTNGVVAAKQPEQHQSVLYYYTIDGIQYTGSSGAGRGNPEFKELNVGDLIIVTYEADYPLNSVMGIPDPEPNRWMAYLLAFCVASATMVQVGLVLFLIRYFRRRRLASPQA